MNKIELYYDKNGCLVMKFDEYLDDNTFKTIARLKGPKVKEILEVALDSPTKKVFIPKKNKMIVVHDDFVVHITDLDQMRKDEPTFDYIRAVNRQELSRKIALAREKTLERINKNKGGIVAGSLALLMTLTALQVATSVNKNQDIMISDPTVTSQTIDVKNSSTSVSPLDFEVVELNVMPKGGGMVESLVYMEPINENQPEEFAYLDYEDRSENEKLKNTAINYYPIIEAHAKTYGLDPELVLALATQERGVHSSITDSGGATGLMQIQNSVWLGHSITAYNFDSNSYETYEVTDDRIRDVNTNIKIGCMILQDMIKNKDYNILAGVLSYNMGGGSVNQIINAHAQKTGKTKSEILSNQNNCDWLQEREIITYGDSRYLEHVLSYMGDDFKTYVYKPGDSVNEKVEVTVRNSIVEKEAIR